VSHARRPALAPRRWPPRSSSPAASRSSGAISAAGAVKST
jgi:hypothetical protein